MYLHLKNINIQPSQVQILIYYNSYTAY